MCGVVRSVVVDVFDGVAPGGRPGVGTGVEDPDFVPCELRDEVEDHL